LEFESSVKNCTVNTTESSLIFKKTVKLRGSGRRGGFGNPVVPGTHTGFGI
jgi:hypothetical protein